MMSVAVSPRLVRAAHGRVEKCNLSLVCALHYIAAGRILWESPRDD
jgi:hypothetical protein